MPEYFGKHLEKSELIRLSQGNLTFEDHRFTDPDGMCIKPKHWKSMGLKKAGVVPVYMGSNLWVFHPTEKNIHGQPKLFKSSFGSYLVEETIDYNVGTLFVKLLAEKFGVKTDW